MIGYYLAYFREQAEGHSHYIGPHVESDSFVYVYASMFAAAMARETIMSTRERPGFPLFVREVDVPKGLTRFKAKDLIYNEQSLRDVMSSVLWEAYANYAEPLLGPQAPRDLRARKLRGKRA